MNLSNNRCGCKGIRSCLLCENKNEVKSKPIDEKELLIYIYCPYCNLCYPENKIEVASTPFYLGKIMLVPSFINEEEQLFLVSAIDEIPWMPSQSGRRKQDFGPKANFKRKKVKMGNFKGFPAFSQEIINRLQSNKELINFLPVELCHLEYTPERGSAIEPHVDDLWLWGDRLVTINLLSSTILTLTPIETSSCHDWPKEMCCDHNSFQAFNNYRTDNLCQHKFMEHELETKVFCTSKELLKKYKINVKIVLPPKSLFVLSGCARRNWLHEIKRKDVTSRRLAMTFRELSKTFEGENISAELLDVAKNFDNFSIDVENQL